MERLENGTSVLVEAGLRHQYLPETGGCPHPLSNLLYYITHSSAVFGTRSVVSRPSVAEVGKLDKGQHICHDSKEENVLFLDL